MTTKARKGTDLEKHFWSKIDKREDHECWKWLAGDNGNGYGVFHVDGINTAAHRFAYESFYRRKIPESLYILHICDEPACCNPLHLFIGTHADNMKDMAEKGRSSRSLAYAKRMALRKTGFYEGEIWLIRKLKIPIPNVYLSKKSRHRYKFSSTSIAKMFKVDSQTILNVWNSKTYPCKEGYFV